MACSIRSGQRADRIVFDDPVGLALMFAPTATAVLGPPRVGQLCTVSDVDERS
jgi:hypothetical protein